LHGRHARTISRVFFRQARRPRPDDPGGEGAPSAGNRWQRAEI